MQTEIGDALAAPGREVTLLEEPLAPECAEDVVCLTRVGHDNGQETLVVARLARLGPTTLLRLQSVDVPVGAMDHTLQTVIDDTDDARLARSMRETAQRLARLYTPPVPWYRRPPFIIAGALLVAATVTGIVLATRAGSPEPDLTVRAP